MNLLSEVIASLLDVELLNRTEELSEQLQDAAASAGWPTLVSIQLRIVVKDDSLMLTIHRILLKR